MTPSMLHLLIGWFLVSLVVAVFWMRALMRRDRREAETYKAALDRGDWTSVDQMTTASGSEPPSANG